MEVALPLSGILLSIGVLLVTLLSIPYLKAKGYKAYLLIGIYWVLLTLSFEILVGYLFAGKSVLEMLQVFAVRR